MKLFTAFICALLFAATANCATRDEVESWKRDFPGVNVGTTFGLRQMVSLYELEVMQATSANVYSTARRLRDRADKDVAEASRLAKMGKRATAREAKEKIDWLVNKFLPFVRKMG